jgi:hypothetical protein
MKTVILTLLASSALYSASPELTDNSAENSGLEMTALQETGTFEPTLLVPQPIGQTDLQIPPPIFNRPPKKTWVAVSLASLFPGLGHVYLGDMETAGGLIATTGGCYGLLYSGRSNPSIRQASVIALQDT